MTGVRTEGVRPRSSARNGSSIASKANQLTPQTHSNRGLAHRNPRTNFVRANPASARHIAETVRAPYRLDNDAPSGDDLRHLLEMLMSSAARAARMTGCRSSSIAY